MVSSTTGDIKKSAAPLVTPLAMSHRFEAKNPAIDRTSLVLVLFMTFTPRHIHTIAGKDTKTPELSVL